MLSLVRRAGPHVVALFVLYHLAATLVTAVPSPASVMSRPLWKQRTVQDEFAAWARRLETLGVSIAPKELEEAAWALCVAWVKGRRIAVRPFRSYQRYTGTRQNWQMFAAPHRYPTRFHIDLREPDSEWRTVYVSRSTEHTWRGHQLEHVRVRTTLFMFAWHHDPAGYDRFVSWLARHAAHDFPNAAEFRIRMYKYRTATPEEVREDRRPIGQFTHTKTVSLERYR